MTAAGLRQRNRERTRNEIIEAALDRFETQGYDATTVDDIAEAAGVSSRTFFRYFESKLDVVMAARGGDPDADPDLDVYGVLVTRPAHESPFEALIETIRGPLTALSSGDSQVLRQYRILMATPSLHPLQLEHFHAGEAPVTAALARRLGVDADDHVGRVLAATAGAVLRTSFEQWITSGAEPGTLVPMIEQSFELMQQGFGALQSTPSPTRSTPPPETAHRRG